MFRSMRVFLAKVFFAIKWFRTLTLNLCLKHFQLKYMSVHFLRNFLIFSNSFLAFFYLGYLYKYTDSNGPYWCSSVTF